MGSERMSIAFLAGKQDGEATHSSSNTESLPPNPTGSNYPRPRMDSSQSISSYGSSIQPSSSSSGRVPDRTGAERQYRQEQQDEEDDEGASPTSASSEVYIGSFRRQPRSPRPTYSEEQRFFVMYARLVQDKSWPDIEEDFARIFKQRSKGGLCSLYYRIRRTWGLEDVLKNDSNYWTLERRIVDEKAYNFSRDFLLSIGYLR